MSYTIVGEQIQKLRKERRLTQKELGEAIGVSSSAVSQWESGGTPDISLLPAIADRLGVTVDTLFGREAGVRQDMAEALGKHVASLPETKRIAEICHLMWEAMKQGCVGQYVPSDNGSNDCHVYFLSEEGVMLGTATKEMSYMCAFPEPEKGYEVLFAAEDIYIKLFSALVKPHALALLKLLYQRPPRHCTTGVIAGRLGLDVGETEKLLEEFASLQLVQKLEMETESGNADAYIVNDLGALPPFFYGASLMVEKHSGMHLICNKRKAPLLKSDVQKG